jgi:site-specific recombinase XerD
MPTPTKAAAPVSSTRRPPPDHLSLILDGWQTHLASQRKSKATIVSYRRCAVALIEYLSVKGMPVTASGLAREHIESFIADLLERVSTATAAKHYRSLQQFTKFMLLDGEITVDPMANMRPPKVVADPVPVLPVETVTKLLKTCVGNTFENRRDTALIIFLFDTGCRVGELVGMKLDDYDAKIRGVAVTGKGGRTRGLNCGTKTLDVLRRYLRYRAAHPMAETTNAFWLGRKGPLTTSGVVQVLKRRCREAGVPAIHPHQFRHTFAHNWLAMGGLESDLMQLAGWQSREMINRYGASAASARAREAHGRQSPADKLL